MMEKKIAQPESATPAISGPSKTIREVFDWAEALVLALVCVTLLFTFVFRPVLVDGASMYPTLDNEDRVIISNLFYSEPKVGDIVVITQPNFTNAPIIKRVIATGGQTVDIDYSQGRVLVNGQYIDESYINEPIAKVDDVVMPYIVEKGHVFVMGDNRNHSTDSRSTLVGTIDNRYVIGHVIVRIFPVNKIGPV